MPAPDAPVPCDSRNPDLVPGPGDALVVTDVQNDFVTGTLAVAGGAMIVAPLNRAIESFHARGLPVVAIRDWHPPGHCSFAAHGWAVARALRPGNDRCRVRHRACASVPACSS